MTNEEIAIGVDLARKALQFAIFSHGKVTAGECRKAVLILFGKEVDEALDNEFSGKTPNVPSDRLAEDKGETGK